MLILTVVGADLILALLRQAFEQNRAFEGTSLQASLNTKFVALASVGLADIAVGEAELALQVRNKAGSAARKGLDWAAGKSLD